MIIAVLSGKGGTGKTTVSTGLAAVIKPSQYIDCDVEEPNGAIFLKPLMCDPIPVKVGIPAVDKALCNGCGDCAKVCQFNAIAVVKGNVLIFPEICHHCGACYIACKQGVLYVDECIIGVIEKNERNTFVQGKLNIGEPVAVPVIKQLKKHQRTDIPVILDCSPGASCTVVQSISDADYCILVTEPTPFGLHDLEIAVGLAKKLRKPLGIVINKACKDNSLITDFCNREGIEVLMEIPYSPEIAQTYSRGDLPILADKRLTESFQSMFSRIKKRVKR
ncbi:MAG: (4Fe-4S)-binding protein [Clostridiales bacterium GWF2_38_85]|nr:MAG: (4Fe-4S)-binding protein [Clostridiales bacterium GWF2_38_85]HBL84523.1 (4Fe-4S)-binding protein [Clostridiales bacterium]